MNERAYIAFRRDLTDEMAYIEREAREQGEADYHDELTDVRLQLATAHEAICQVQSGGEVMNILVLLKRANIKGYIGYDQRKARWEAVHAAAAELCARLPFKWHAVAMDNPTQNHTGTTNGRDHIVLDEAFDSGRLHRAAGQPLCNCDTANLWNPAFEGHVTCARCLAMAERIVEAAQ